MKLIGLVKRVSGYLYRIKLRLDREHAYSVTNIIRSLENNPESQELSSAASLHVLLFAQ